MTLERKIEIMEGFTKAFQKNAENSKIQREVACLKVQFPATFMMPEKGDLLAGYVEVLPIGFFPQEGGLGYFCNSEMLQELHRSLEITKPQHPTLISALYI